MARIRSVHPSLFTDEAWVSCTPLARILYIGLWTDADDQGLFEWKPLQLKMRLLPGDGANAGELLDELCLVGLIQQCEKDGKRLGAIRDFRKFQRPQKPNAIHPMPENMEEYLGISLTDPKRVSDEYDTGTVKPSQMEDGGEEKKKEPPTPKGEAKRSRRKPEVSIPDDFPDLKAKQSAVLQVSESGKAVKISLEAEKFRNHAAQNDRLARDWPAAWRNWIINACERAPALGLVQREVQTEHDPWPMRVRAWINDTGWNHVDWGPEPFERGCKVPSHHLPPRAAE